MRTGNRRALTAALWIIAGMLLLPFTVRAETIYDSPYVTLAPDGKAWTADAGNQAVQWYATDGSDDIQTGISSSLSALRQGQHYYQYRRSGRIPVGEWKVVHSYGVCCHTSYPDEGTDYHGISFTRQPCGERHFSGWMPYCADCGELLTPVLHYISKDAAASLRYLEIGVGLDYYSLCPFCGNLEQGAEETAHLCKGISANRYRVEYLANTSGAYSGYMAPSLHMVDNATEYEGEEVTPQTHLTRNSYTRIGWEFVGWNTRADGTGTTYGDEAEIWNLTTEDYQPGGEEGIVKLYAMWRRSVSTLEVDPAGGSYQGSTGLWSVSGDYGDTVTLQPEQLVAPTGYTVTFVTNGGTETAPVTATMHFARWIRKGDFRGKLSGNRYQYCANDGHTDRLQAAYERDAIVLPAVSKENASFGGWYADEQCTALVGQAGELYTPIQDVTLYAGWAELYLEAAENYEAYDGTGAVDLTWSQPDGQDKVYQLYQRAEGGWQQIASAEDIADKLTVTQGFSMTGQTVSYTVAYSGFYTLTAEGAQGGGYETYEGGLGGSVSAKFWLEKGEVLSVTVGGQDGYNGGGTGEDYGNGGGRTEVTSSLQGLLMVAGGGGGATAVQNGGAGGLSQGLTLTGQSGGEDGAAGGGAGAVGGSAGVLLRHYHVSGECNHVHTGDSSQYGGCYTEAVSCNKTLTSTYTDTKGPWKEPGYCVRCGGECVGDHTEDHYDHTCSVHGLIVNNASSDTPSVCTETVGYAPACGLTEDYTCGYEVDGSIIRSEPGYGGSSYVNEAAAYSYVLSAGEREGDGSFLLQSVTVGYLDETALYGVEARDTEAPCAVSAETVSKTAGGENTVWVEWQEPTDNGTRYEHCVKSYQAATDQLMCVSNITATVLTSGLKGYYYWLDGAETSAMPENASFMTGTGLRIALKEDEQYLHLCPADRAGNVGEPLDIRMGSLKGGTDVAWPLYTEQISVTEADNVCAGETTDTYYVRNDAAAPVEMRFSAYIDGIASDSYQPEKMSYMVSAEGNTVRLGTILPTGAVGDGELSYSADQLAFFAEGETVLLGGSYTVASRTRECREAELVRQFYVNHAVSGQALVVYPEARAYLGDKEVVTEEAADLRNAVTLIPDGEGPEISGSGSLEDLPLLDRRDGELRLELSAADALSGVQDFYLQIENTDNGSVQRFWPDEDGCIRMVITEDFPVYSGDLEITVYASDRVGNETTERYGTTEFDLQTEILRVLEPHEPQFKRGETGVLNIKAWGYAEKVEVLFPEELTRLHPEWNQTYIYDIPDDYCREETITFMIPLELEEDATFTVTVRAYKGDRMLEQHPSFSVMDVSGTVLDEIRTRLR